MRRALDDGERRKHARWQAERRLRFGGSGETGPREATGRIAPR
jgi:hypothetical protein